MKRCYKIALCCLFVLLGAVACTDDPVQEALSDDGRLVTGFWIASPLPVHAGQTLTMLGTGFAEGDVVRFESGTGSFESPLAQVSESFACTTVPAGMASGGYDLTLVRGAASQRLARVNLRITLDPTRIPDREGATIKGVVYCGLEPVAGVRVSDGFETAVTDADGYYWLASDKRQGYVSSRCRRVTRPRAPTRPLRLSGRRSRRRRMSASSTISSCAASISRAM